MNINVNNLDLGYEECETLNNIVRVSGENLLGSLSTNIGNLMTHWIGSDASNHINNLIYVYDALGALLTDAKKITADAGSAIIAIQEIRNANGGSGNIGNVLDGNAPEIHVIAKIDSTSEYFVDSLALNDYQLLCEICTNFDKFVSDFTMGKEELLNNWTAGANREGALNRFNEFEANCDTYKKYLTDARNNLEIAVNNISQL